MKHGARLERLEQDKQMRRANTLPPMRYFECFVLNAKTGEYQSEIWGSEEYDGDGDPPEGWCEKVEYRFDSMEELYAWDDTPCIDEPGRGAR